MPEETPTANSESDQAINLSPQLQTTLQTLDLLNSQLGIIGALIVSEYHTQRQLAAYQQPQYPNQSPAPGQYPPPANNPPQPQVPPIAQDFASLANIVTQIQYDLFDISVTLAQQQIPDQIDSRIDEKAINWIQDIINKISTQLPQHEDPILPIGNLLATNTYQAKTYCQQAAFQLAQLKPEENQQIIGDQQAKLHDQYLQLLQAFLFAIFRWSNLILRERDWFWKPKSEMQQSTDQPAPPSPGVETGVQSHQSVAYPMTNTPQPQQQQAQYSQSTYHQPPTSQPIFSQTPPPPNNTSINNNTDSNSRR